MKKISALLFLAAMLIAAGLQAQTTDTTSTAVSSISTLEQKAGDARSSAKFKAECAAGLALDSCAKPVTPPGCPAGQHWTTMGSGVAHCVADDPVCAGTVTHDTLGNPTGCTPTVVSTSYNYRYFDCPVGETGTDYERYQVMKWSDGTTTTGPWEVITYTCAPSAPATPTPTPTCSNGASDYPTCTPASTPPPATTCANGASNYPTCTLPSSGDSTPVATCSASDTVVSSTACGPGMTGGPIQDHQTVTCPGSVVGSYKSGTCTAATCANGATNYPTCTFADTTPLICPDAGKQTYGCSVSGSTGTIGSYMLIRYSDDGTGTGTCKTVSTKVGTCGNLPTPWHKEY